ncbi:MAG: C1 family peptidase [Pyrinomonadaceae bacterium]
MRKNNLLVALTVVIITSFMTTPVDAQTDRERDSNGKRTGQTQVGQSNNSPEVLPSQPRCTGEGSITWGKLVIPKGESKRAVEIRKKVISYQQQIRNKVTKSMEVWINANPNATAQETAYRRRSGQERIEYKINKIYAENQARLKLKSWDWSKLLNVGAVLAQGRECNTCWAFAANSAVFSSLQKNYEENVPLFNYVFPDQKTGELAPDMGLSSNLNAGRIPDPFVQDLLNCMPIEGDICNTGWHGNAFDFMVYNKGIPLARDNNSENTNYLHRYIRGQKSACSANGGFIKATTWDYVNSPPDKLPTVARLKKALIEHGPLVAPIHYDQCLENYKGGVFDEKNMKDISHAVLLIGWDDEKQAWRVKNSWGEEWGEKGFAWIKYGSNNIGVFAAWVDAAI